MVHNRVTGGIVELDSGTYYRIENAQDMPAFFINLAAASDIWMFLSSGGALTAGRQNADCALFPYETDDRLHLATATGPKTYIRLADGRVWEPFDGGYDNPFAVRRNLYKRLTGDAVLFEEINDTLRLAFSYRWEASEKYGIVRTAAVKNLSDNALSFEMLDGVVNVIPYGISRGLADGSSCLTDAYKACERLGGNNLAVFSLTSAIVDTPEPVEILHANVAWRIGEAAAYLLSARQVAAFCEGVTPADEQRSVGRKGAYLAYSRLTLAPGALESWLLIMDARLSQHQVVRLNRAINEKPPAALRTEVEEDIARGTAELIRVVAAADGLQLTEDTRATSRHYMNVLYNNMRGGVFLDGYSYDVTLFERFVSMHDRALAERRGDFFAHLRLPGHDSILRLHDLAFADGDQGLIRLSLEFLPLTFSRRHGDPSRPWNAFHIRVKDDAGNRLYHYEGNWRDIFQNWEAMSLSFPSYIEPMIAKFLNASTADGFNPYRINEEGVDWEAPQPHNPFSGYGYWGDHQIVYLNKLLEWLEAYEPERLTRLLTDAAFVYAEVPYEIKPYAALLKDGKNTINFNREKHERIMNRVKTYGTDGKLLMDGGKPYQVSFMEKLLVPVLAKLSNLVAGGGIWMNTQRPEWNDANNAIVGNGLSMVTVYQLYRHLQCCKKMARCMGETETAFSMEVLRWMEELRAALAGRMDKTARALLDEVGAAFDRYRARVYAEGFSGKAPVKGDDLVGLFEEAERALAETIDANKRADGLYNAYNILTLTQDGLTVTPMFPMLEGQTAVLGSGRLSPEEALALTLAMENSGLYGVEHKTFYLYPVKELKTFVARNIIPAESAAESALAARLLAEGHEGFLLKDADGHIRFHESIQCSADLESALSRLKQDERYAVLAEAETERWYGIYEQVFAHRQFTGRSGIMYKYEGIGSIYWHQNAKFLLSFQECFTNASESGCDNAMLKTLKDTYYRLRAGFGFNKEPSLWGAFPLEPYSHTPSGQPAQQPGMTGQVKEDILTRYAELGLSVQDGTIRFKPALLNRAEFLQKRTVFRYIAVDGEARELPLEEGTLAFTVCQVPVVYRLAHENKTTVHTTDGGAISKTHAFTLDKNVSRSLFARDGQITRIEVDIAEETLV